MTFWTLDDTGCVCAASNTLELLFSDRVPSTSGLVERAGSRGVEGSDVSTRDDKDEDEDEDEEEEMGVL